MGKPLIITIEGNIGSGKSTLLENLQKEYKDNKNIIFLKEPVDEWEKIKDNEGNTILQKFYKNQELYSFPFQMMAYISRLVLLKNTIKENPNCIIISERSLYTDKYVFAKMLYESGKIENVNYQIYNKWFETFVDDFPINSVIYVKTDPDICNERILKRSRLGEDNIPLEYLIKCNLYHEKMLDIEQQVICKKMLVLDGNIDIYKNKNNLNRWIEDINDFIL